MYICHIINQTKIFKMKKLMYLLVAGSLSVFTACSGDEAAKDTTKTPPVSEKGKVDKKGETQKAAPVKKEEKKEENK